MDPSPEPRRPPWASPAWRAQAVAWLDKQLAVAGSRRTGAVEQPHLRPWSTVLTAPTSHGRVWMKACEPGTAFEVGLYGVLALVAPERVLTPIGLDRRRGWLLLPDGGPPLADRLEGDELIDAFVTILPRYAQLQRDVAAEAARLLALGVSDMRPAIMPRRFDEALDAIGDRLEPATRERVTAMRATFGAWCERLASMPGVPSIDHNDLHPWNMLVPRLDQPHDVRFYDWGDAVIAHPFASMLVPLTWLQDQLGFGVGSAAAIRVRDAYLSVFRDLAAPAELIETLELACRVGKVTRALIWDRAVRSSAPTEVDAFYASAPASSLAALRCSQTPIALTPAAATRAGTSPSRTGRTRASRCTWRASRRAPPLSDC